MPEEQVRHFIRNPNIRRLALCKVGANRQRIFLLKDGEGEHAVAAIAQLVKEPGADWKTAYVPVAVPLSEEDPGMFGDRGSVDLWEPAEIAAAAHGFMANGAGIVAKHFDDENAPGVKLVESAVALTDFKVGDTLIKEGTWYVGLEFEGQARELVDRGEIDAVSVEGMADRVLAKVETFSKPGTADVTPSDRAKIKPLAMHYLAQPHPFTACVRDQEKHGLTPDHAKRRCAVLLDTFDPARLRHSVAKDAELDEETWAKTADELAEGAVLEEEGMLAKIAKSLGIKSELAKTPLTTEARKSLPVTAFVFPKDRRYPIHDLAHARNALARSSGKPEEATVRAAVCKRFPDLCPDKGRVAKGLAEDGGIVGDVEISERVEALEKRVGEVAEGLTALTAEDGPLAKLAAGQGEIAKRLPEPEPTEPTNAELKNALAKAEQGIGKLLSPLAVRIEALESGDTTQDDLPQQEPVAKAAANGKAGSATGVFFDYEDE